MAVEIGDERVLTFLVRNSRRVERGVFAFEQRVGARNPFTEKSSTIVQKCQFGF